MSYKPGRDHRFEDVTDVMNFIEEMQCKNCIYKKDFVGWGISHANEYPMCHEIEVEFFVADVDFKPIDSLEDRGDDGVVCLKFTPQWAHPDQTRLF